MIEDFSEQIVRWTTDNMIYLCISANSPALYSIIDYEQKYTLLD